MSINQVIALAALALGGACELEPGRLEAELGAPHATHKAQVKRGALTVTGTAEGSHLALRLQTPAILAVDVGDDGSAEFTFDRSTFDRITIDAGDGDDFVRIDDSGGAFTTEETTTIGGGRGNDTLLGGAGSETLLGGAGDDVIDGGMATDTIFMGDGADTFVWDPGDSSDDIEGEAGADVLLFNGANIGEQIALAESAGRLIFTRNIALVTLDVAGVERVDVVTRGGTDEVVVGDLAGTDVERVNVDLALSPGGGGDAQADKVVVEGTAGLDAIDVAAEGAAVVATGLAVEVCVTSGEPALDSLVVNGAGGDLVDVNGSPAADTMEVHESAGHAVVAVAGFNVLVDASGMATLGVNGLGGDDLVRAAPAAAALPLRLDGGEGNDQVLGGSFADALFGGPGDDVIDGGPNADAISMGDGNDTFVWDPGDGSDVIEGEAGADAVVFNGSAANEQIDVTASGGRLRVLRNVATITLDAGGVERVDLAARGGTDNVVVGDLAGTEVTRVNVDLAAFPGGAGDALVDAVLVQGTAGADDIDVAADGAAVVARGLAAEVAVTSGEPALDLLAVTGSAGDLVDVNGAPGSDTMEVYESAGHARVAVAGFNVIVDSSGAAVRVNGLGGDDFLRLMPAAAPLPVQLDGGEGNDQVFGGSFADVLAGGPGHDVMDGGPNADTISMGDGDDTFTWDPGDGSDVVEGEAGADAVVFNGSNIGEAIDVAANAGRLRITRNIATVTLDLGGLERVDLNVRGGTDNVVVNDLAGTGVALVNLDLALVPGGGVDAASDVLTVQGSPAPDAIAVTLDAGEILVSGLAAATRIRGHELLDQLVVNGLGGVDTITTGAGVEGLILLTVNQD